MSLADGRTQGEIERDLGLPKGSLDGTNMADKPSTTKPSTTKPSGNGNDLVIENENTTGTALGNITNHGNGDDDDDNITNSDLRWVIGAGGWLDSNGKLVSTDYNNGVPPSTGSVPPGGSTPSTPVLQSDGSYKTKVVLADGTTVTGIIKNGKTTLENGSSVPVGAVVTTLAGNYTVTALGGVPTVDAPIPVINNPVTPPVPPAVTPVVEPVKVNSTTMLANGDVIQTYVLNGKTYNRQTGELIPRGNIVNTTLPDGTVYQGGATAPVVTPPVAEPEKVNSMTILADGTTIETYVLNGKTYNRSTNELVSRDNIVNTILPDGTVYKGDATLSTPTPEPEPEPEPEDDVPDVNLWDQFTEWASKYTKKPDVDVPTIDSLLGTLTSQREGAHLLDEQNLANSRNESMKKLAASLAARGVYNSDINDSESAKLYNKYDTAGATLDSQYSTGLANEATSLYNTALDKATSTSQTYNQMMINLGLSIMSGMIDMEKFTTNTAYQNTMLSRLFGNDWVNMFQIVK